MARIPEPAAAWVVCRWGLFPRYDIRRRCFDLGAPMNSCSRRRYSVLTWSPRFEDIRRGFSQSFRLDDQLPLRLMTDPTEIAVEDVTPTPVVSVIVITYRHEAFIEQAVQSVLSQKTDFSFEVLISEDLSPDATREIVEMLRSREPDRIRTFLSERNQNDNAVLARAWRAARGKYIAFLDGDDYWTDPNKLQKQVDF